MFRNPYIILGTVGLVWFFIRTRKSSPKKTIIERAFTKDDNTNGLPSDFISKVDKMSSSEIKRTMAHNVKMAERTDMSEDELDKMNKMINYMADEFSKRT